GLIAAAASSSTLGRLRAASVSFSSAASTMIKTSSSARDLSCASSSLVWGWSTATEAVTTSRSWRTSSDNIERIAPRYILRFTFWVKSRGCAAKVRPPPTQIGLRIEPARAEPVPFWACGFLPPPRTSARVFCALLPARPAARYAFTTWNTSDWLYTWPKFSSDTASSAPPLATLSFMTSRLLVRLYGLAQRMAGRLHRGAHHDVAAFRARDRAADQQQVALGVHHHNFQVLGGAANHAHVARHALARKHPARRLALADRARHAV